MRGRDTLILLAILVLLGGYYYFFEIRSEKEESTESSAPQSTDIFEGVWAEDVTALTVKSISGTVELRLPEGGTWHIEKPTTEEADHDKVQAAVSSVVQLSASRTLTEDIENLAVYGLAPPQAVLTMTLKNGGERTLLIGDKNPTGNSYYVRRPDEAEMTIYLVPAYAVDQVKNFIGQPPVKPTPTPTPPATPTTETGPPVTPTVEVTVTP